MKKSVCKFYEYILEDNVTKSYFKGVNMELQQSKQVSFLSQAFGGPKEYTGQYLNKKNN